MSENLGDNGIIVYEGKMFGLNIVDTFFFVVSNDFRSPGQNFEMGPHSSVVLLRVAYHVINYMIETRLKGLSLC